VEGTPKDTCCSVGNVCNLTTNSCEPPSAEDHPISLCENYLNKSSCNSDRYNIGTFSVERNLLTGESCNSITVSNTSCTETLDSCICNWNSSTNLCENSFSKTISCPSPTGGPPTGGVCSYTSTANLNACNGTESSVISILTANWLGNESDRLSDCVDKTTRIPCPAQIKLSFFSWYNWIVAIIILGIIYYSLEKFRKGKKVKFKKIKNQKRK